MDHQSKIAANQASSFLVANDIGWIHPNGELLFSDVSFAIEKQKVGIVGRNGVGKSLLLKILVGQLQSATGKVHRKGRLAYLPQNFVVDPQLQVSDVLHVSHKVRALSAIEKGSTDPAHFEVLGDDWDINEQIAQMLTTIDLPQLDLNRQFTTLSGGEATRVFLAGLMLKKPDLLVLDEPTNNLDLQSKNALYDMVSQWQAAVLLVSHDRKLLNLLDRIHELSPMGLKSYLGNYDHYLAQKSQEEEALQRQLKTAQLELKKTKREIQRTKEKHQQRQAKGRGERRAGSQSKLVLNARQERSEGTAAGLKKSAERQLDQQQKTLHEARLQVEELEGIDVSLVGGKVPNGKTVLEIEALHFAYTASDDDLLHDFNLTLTGPERIWLKGPNGSGKTTLLKLIQAAHAGEPAFSSARQAGILKVGVDKVVYLDQHIRVLDEEKSIFENFREYQPDMPESDVRWRLATFLFKGDAVFKQVKKLSGGEKLRAAMACLFMHEEAPQFLLLDEPTNHLDLSAIASFEAILNQYQGAFLLISHDETFVKNLRINRTVEFGR